MAPCSFVFHHSFVHVERAESPSAPTHHWTDSCLHLWHCTFCFDGVVWQQIGHSVGAFLDGRNHSLPLPQVFPTSDGGGRDFPDLFYVLLRLLQRAWAYWLGDPKYPCELVRSRGLSEKYQVCPARGSGSR